MKIIKTIIISIFSMLFIGIATAQNKNKQHENQSAKVSNAEQKMGKVLIFEMKTDFQKVAFTMSMNVLKNEVKNKLVVILPDTVNQILSISIDTSKVKLSEIKERLNNKCYVLLMPENKIEEKVVEAKTIPTIEKYNPEIDKFLNLEDTTFFTSKFKTYGLLEVHPSRRNYYLVVQKIHDFGETLKSIENNLSDSTINELAEVAKNSLLEAAKTNIAKAEKDLDWLIPFGKELDILSTSQKQYYKTLKDKFNDLYSKIIPD